MVNQMGKKMTATYGMTPRRLGRTGLSLAGTALERIGSSLAGTALGLALMALGFGCTAEIDIDLQGGAPPALVVDARLTTDTIRHTVALNRSSDYYTPTSDHLAVSGATVYITGDGRRFDFAEDTAAPGIYRSLDRFAGRSGSLYTLMVEGVDMDGDGETETYTAESELPFMTDRIDSLKAVYAPGLPPFFMPDPQRLGWNILLYAQDPPAKDYYAFTVSVNGQAYDGRLTEMTRMPDDFTQGLYIDGLPLYFFPDDGETPLSAGDTISLEAWGITPEFNRYISDVRTATRPSMPMFGGSPANVRGNISGGAFGCFAAYAVRRGQVVLK